MSRWYLAGSALVSASVKLGTRSTDTAGGASVVPLVVCHEVTNAARYPFPHAFG
jgi:hypothetical protein